MKFNEFNSLIDLYFEQSQKQNPQHIFLEWLNVTKRKKFSWSETTSSIYKLAKVLKNHVEDGDRVLLVSENRPEWLIADLAIMLANGITVPAYTTYTENDYKYLIEDCEPTVVILSNNLMHKKLEKIIKNNFENRTYNEWKNLSDEFNFNWIINLEYIKGVDIC